MQPCCSRWHGYCQGDMVTDWNVSLDRAIYAVAQFIPAYAFYHTRG